MKTEISRDSYQPAKRYSGVYQQQGRMLTDADWNELVEIMKGRLNEALKDVVGVEPGSRGGTPKWRALQLIDDPADVFKIAPGIVYAQGLCAQMPGDSNLVFAAQPDFPSPPAPSGNYVLYADLWERSVTQLVDARLRDKGLHNADTCSRKQTLLQVKWCPENIDPQTSAKNPSKGNAPLSLSLVQKATTPDPCDPCAAELDIESRVGNYLFRVEVHDVVGDADNPGEITLKWSRENGAEHFESLNNLSNMPAGFIANHWVYEFYDETSDRHLGNHLDNTAWQASRGVLVPGNAYAPATVPGSSETRTLVRRWDGYCKIDLSGGSLVEGVDRGVTLSTALAADNHGYVDIGSRLTVVFEAIKLELDLNSRSFVAGDFWLADVREAEHDPGDPGKSRLIENREPQGIEHRYLTLGSVNAGTLNPNQEAERKLAFPALTELTRLFHIGGDGQEAMPEHFVAQSIKAGVANGEWPVAGAKLEFKVTLGGGKLDPHPDFPLENFNPGVATEGIATSAAGARHGWACCRWQLGSSDRQQRVTVHLVDPDSKPGDSDYPRYLEHPPIHFYANLSTADQVAYTNPTCSESTTINQLFDEDPGITWPDHDADGDVTVKDVLDALLCQLRADHIPYDDPGCTGSNTVQSLLGSLDTNSDGHLTVRDVLDTLLCRLEARHVPYDPAPRDARWDDINEGPDRPTTVQGAIDDLAENLESTDIRYQIPDCGTSAEPTVRSLLNLTPGTVKIDQVLDQLLCDLKATEVPLDKDATLCGDLKSDSSVLTVQDAINALCEREQGDGCAVVVGKGGQIESLEEALVEPGEGGDICICLLPGDHVISKDLALKSLRTIKIVGCGALLSRIFIIDQLAIAADEIIFRDLSVHGGEPGGASTSAGVLLLSGDDSRIAVENCAFNRVFRGKDSDWQPPVAIEGLTQITWRGNQMRAVRQQEKVYGTLLPKDDGFSAELLKVYGDLETVWNTSPYDDSKAFDEKVRQAAEGIVGLPEDERTAFFEARYTGRIDRLPVTGVDISPPRFIRGDAGGTAFLAMTDGTQPAGTDTGAFRMTVNISPKNEVIGLYEDIRIASAANLETLIERIKNVAMLVSTEDVALSLMQNTVEGNILDNHIDGYLALFAATVDWPALVWKPGNPGNKKKLEQQNLPTGVGMLNIQGNTLSKVQSMVDKDAFGKLNALIDGSSNSTAGIRFEGYESLSVQNNRIIDAGSSFLGRNLRISNNHLAADPKTGVVAYAYTVTAVATANLAEHDEPILELVSSPGRDREAGSIVQFQ